MKRDEDEDVEGEENESKRSNRNLNEKKRRDRFNILVGELAGIVFPENERKLDKTTVLRHAINFLKNQQSHDRSVPRTSRQATASWQPSFTTDAEFNLILSEALDSFVLAISKEGHIKFASQSVLPLLGYLPSELEGTSLFSYMQQSDALRIWSQLHLTLDRSDKTGINDRKHSFQFPLKCGNFYSKFSRQVVDCMAAVISRPHSDQKEQNECEQNCEFIVIVGKVDQPRPNRTVTSADCQHKEFSYRLTMDWKYVFLDHRASSIIGFLPFEVLGTSFYEYCSPEELFNIAQYQKILIRLGKVTTCYFRHLTKGQSWVWLQTCCYVSYNQWNSKPESITGTATVVNFEEVCSKQAKQIQRDRERYKTMISRNGSGSMSPTCSWPSSPLSATGDIMQQQQVDSQQRNVDEAAAHEQKGSKKSIFAPHFLKSLMRTPSDQLLEVINAQSDVEFESDEGQTNHHLAWLENIKFPPGLTSVQLQTHIDLLQEYKKIVEQIRKQERQLKLIKKLIEWSNLLLEVGSNFGAAGESSVDSSEAPSSIGNQSYCYSQVMTVFIPETPYV